LECILNEILLYSNVEESSTEKSSLSINTLYYIQRKGDSDNVLYDSLTKHDLSSYKRYEGIRKKKKKKKKKKKNKK